MTITGTDLNLTEAFIDKFADTPEQAEAVKKVLGVNSEVEKLADSYTPYLPFPEVPRMSDADVLAHAEQAIEQFTEWVASFPDDDPTPLKERERCLVLARRDLARLEARNANTDGDNR